VDLLWIKLILTPLTITGIALAGRRWGPAVGGWIAGLPLTSGPVSLYLALEQGRTFAADAAVSSLAGGAAVGGFCLAYAAAASRRGWMASTACGLSVFFSAAALFRILPLSLLPTFVAVTLLLTVVFFLLPVPGRGFDDTAGPWWDLPFRAVVATGIVFLLTEGAQALGPRWSGLLAPFPLFANVTVAFAHRNHGAEAGILALRGIVLALFAFAVFFLAVGGLLPRFGTGWTYAIAATLAAAVNGFSLRGIHGNVEVD
jgi:hypothetical protein